MWPSRGTAILLILQITKLKLREAQGHAGLVTEEGLEPESFPQTRGPTTSPFPILRLELPRAAQMMDPAQWTPGTVNYSSSPPSLGLRWNFPESELAACFTAANHSS